MINRTKLQDGRRRELTVAEVEAVSGGLNPQPLPPRWSFPAWNIRLLSALRPVIFNTRPLF